MPQYGLTVGLGTIIDNSKEVVMLIHGKEKKDSLIKLISFDDFSMDWPASFIYLCKNYMIYTDKTAFGEI